jgi:hypothetical protein
MRSLGVANQGTGVLNVHNGDVAMYLLYTLTVVSMHHDVLVPLSSGKEIGPQLNFKKAGFLLSLLDHGRIHAFVICI